MLLKELTVILDDVKHLMGHAHFSLHCDEEYTDEEGIPVGLEEGWSLEILHFDQESVEPLEQALAAKSDDLKPIFAQIEKTILDNDLDAIVFWLNTNDYSVLEVE